MNKNQRASGRGGIRGSSWPARCGVRFCLGVCLSGWSMAASGQDTSDDVKVARAEAAKAAAEAIQAFNEAQQIRLEILKRAAELEEIRRQRALEERATVEQELNELKKRMEYQNQVRGWALRHFNSKSKRRPEANANGRLQRFQRVREQNRQLFLGFPEKAAGHIQKGTALNFFLDACGEAAVEHVVALKSLESAIANLEMQFEKAAEGNPADQSRKAEIEQEIKIGRDRLKLLQALGGMQPLDPELLKLVRCAQGLTGPQLVVSIEDGPMPLDWPVRIRAETRYDLLRHRLEGLRNSALDDLQVYGEVRGDRVEAMMEAIDLLTMEFNRDKRENWFSMHTAPRGPGFSAGFVDAKRFVRELRAGAYRLAAARSRDEFSAEKFDGKTAQDLLAFMSRHGLSFAAASQRSEAAHLAIFKTLSAYYQDLYALEMMEASEKRRQEMLKQRSDELQSIVLNSPLDDAEKAMDSIRLKFPFGIGGD
ncbi:MAG: hypothetical protein AB7O62_19125 [Pirellulales bacterium]